MSLKAWIRRVLGRTPTPPAAPPSLPTLLREIGAVLENLAQMPHPDPTIPQRLRQIRNELADVEAACRNPRPKPDTIPTPPPTHLLQ